MPSRWQFAAARLRYEQLRVRAWWRLATGRCPGCPKTPRGPHKFGCYKPGVPASVRQIRKSGGVRG
jgi:hypothetical protein